MQSTVPQLICVCLCVRERLVSRLMHIMPALFSALWAVLSIKHNASIMQALKRFFGALCRAGKFTLARLILVIGLWYPNKMDTLEQSQLQKDGFQRETSVVVLVRTARSR